MYKQSGQSGTILRQRTDYQHDNVLHYLSSLVTDPTVACPVRPGEVVGPVDHVQAGEQGREYDPRGGRAV